MACIPLRSSAVRVHDSQADRKMDVTRERISREGVRYKLKKHTHTQKKKNTKWLPTFRRGEKSKPPRCQGWTLFKNTLKLEVYADMSLSIQWTADSYSKRHCTSMICVVAREPDVILPSYEKCMPMHIDVIRPRGRQIAVAASTEVTYLTQRGHSNRLSFYTLPFCQLVVCSLSVDKVFVT